jgi:beta-phosphoglucomutase-like phosphatase (HAD superfamily)
MAIKEKKIKFEKSQIIKKEEASAYWKGLFEELGCSEVALIKNPSYVYSPMEVYPLAPRTEGRIAKLLGVVKDMDGTTTTTEPLCLHSLEWMVRRITDRIPAWSSGERGSWAGLDKIKDYPHIIGNSTTKHVEYLVQTYQNEIVFDSFKRSYIEASLWTLVCGKDPGRRKEVLANISALGLDGLLEEPTVQPLLKSGSYDEKSFQEVSRNLMGKYSERFILESLTDQTRASVDIYYMRYHSILMDISAGKGLERSQELLKEPGKRLVESMPGVGIFIAMLKGWLADDADTFYEILSHEILHRAKDWNANQLENNRKWLAAMGRYFKDNPVKISVVTSSIAYEADIVLTEVFSVIREQIKNWPVTPEKKDFLLKQFMSYKDLYDGFITASDSSEIRLKPHRDLYSIALHQMGIPNESFQYVAGFEDSESGTIAIRAAGIGLCIAVPFADTAGHNLSAATHVLHGQLPEFIMGNQCYLELKELEKYL